MNEILKIIAQNGLYDEYTTTTENLSKKINLSQQSTSRILIKMEELELINKISSKNGTKLHLTFKGIKTLEYEYEILNKIFTKKLYLTCKVTNGIGEGKFYVDLYSEKIKRLLGYKPYLGTLNLQANISDIKLFIRNKKALIIPSFKDKKRTYGEVIIIPVKINNHKCAILKPKRTTHKEDIVEIIFNRNLKKELNIDIGSKVVIR